MTFRTMVSSSRNSVKKKTLSLKFIVISIVFYQDFWLKLIIERFKKREEDKKKFRISKVNIQNIRAKWSDFKSTSRRICIHLIEIFEMKIIFEINNIRTYYHNRKDDNNIEFELWERLNNICNKEKCDDFINNPPDFLPFFLPYFHFDIRDYHRF